MKILDFSNGMENLPIEFNRETVVVMAHTPKILVFEKSQEILTFSNIFKHTRISLHLNREYKEILYCIIDYFEEESFMMNYKINNVYKYIGRKLKVLKGSNNYNHEMIIRFGVSSCLDIYINPKMLNEIVKIMEKFLKIEKFISNLELNQLIMIIEIIKIFKEDLNAYNEGKFFKTNFPEY